MYRPSLALACLAPLVIVCAANVAPSAARAQSAADLAAAHKVKLANLRRAGEQLARELEASWRYVTADEKREACEYFGAEAQHDGDTPLAQQHRAIARALKLGDRDPSLWPVETELAYFDPHLHAPKDPIARRRLAPSDAKARDAARQFHVDTTRSYEFRYDWATRDVRRGAAVDPVEHAFANVLLGLGPDADLATALVERALDDGSKTAQLAAFEHAYTDRDGNVYPFTLYDAWSSGADLEMPDIDTLGIVHDVLKDWKRWSAPVPPREHKALYEETLGPLFVAARKHRGPRTALAQLYLRAAPGLSEGYDAAIGRLHALWAYQAEVPLELARAVNAGKDWDAYFLAWTTSVARTSGLQKRGEERQLRMLEAEQQVRLLFQRVMKELELWGRTQLPREK